MKFKKSLRLMLAWCSAFGFNPLVALRSITGFGFFLRDLVEWNSAGTTGEEDRESRLTLMPCLDDRFSHGSIGGHYFHQDLLVARRIYEANPDRHVDIGSRIDGFVAHVAAFREIEVFDVRQPCVSMKNVSFTQCDMTNEVSIEMHNYCDSLSCLHALEHFGLGRYGDPISRDGHLRGMRNIRQILKPGGTLYLSVPIGPQRVEFNAQRVFSVEHLISVVCREFTIREFSYVDDRGELHENVALDQSSIADNFGCFFGCGIIEAS